MGKVKKIVMDASQEAEVKAKAVSKKKKMIIWEELYSDLTPHVALALREARVKPDQLTTMSDGDLTAIDGINDTALEEIRSKYSPDLSVPVEESTADVPAETEAPVEEKSGIIPPNKRHTFRHGKAIVAAKSKIDRTKFYPVEEAVKLVKSTNITNFDATVTVHLNLVGKDAPTRLELTFPYLAGAAKKVAIVSDEILANLEKGKIDFDILVTHPSFMPKLAKYAKLLGPKGLMPSPKAGTVTPDPEKKAQEFAAGKTMIKAEAKFPLMHITVGKISQKEEELIQNIRTLLEAVKPRNIGKATLASTMSPGIKLQLN